MDGRDNRLKLDLAEDNNQEKEIKKMSSLISLFFLIILGKSWQKCF